jgi:hypothetical protein
MRKRLHIPYSEKGRRVGEAHPKARLSDEQVEMLREIYARRTSKNVGYRALALYAMRNWGIAAHPNTIKSIVSYSRRATKPSEFRVIIIDVPSGTSDFDAIKLNRMCKNAAKR